MSQAYLQLMGTIERTRHHWRSQRALEGALLVLAALGLALMLATALDQWQRLSIEGRLVTAVLLWTGVGVVFWRYLLRPMSAAHSDDYFAALLEERLSLGNQLINAVQLGREEHVPAPRLVHSIIEDALTVADRLDPIAAVAEPALGRFCTALAVVAVFAGMYTFIGGEAARTSFWRVLFPTASIAPFSYTHLQVTVNSQGHILAGSALTVSVTATGLIPDHARMHWSTARGGQGSAAMDPRGSNHFRYQFQAVQPGLTIYVTAGDAQSLPMRLDVDTRPAITQASVRYHYPLYAALSTQTVKDFTGRLRGLAHTTAELSFHTNKALQTLTIMSNGKALQAAKSMGGDGKVWRCNLSLTKASTYQVRLHDRQGYTVIAPMLLSITLDQDSPPTVAIPKPGRDVVLAPRDKLAITIIARDDYGIGPVKLMGAVTGRHWRKAFALKTWPAEGPPKRQVVYHFTLDPSSLGLVNGSTLDYWAVTADRNNITGPGRAQSEHYRARVLNPHRTDAMLTRDMASYARAISELIRLQQLNRDQAGVPRPAAPLIERQVEVRKQTRALAARMRRNAFPATTIIDQLDQLAAGAMPQVITLLESYRDAREAAAGLALAKKSLPVQDHILDTLQKILLRLNQARQIRRKLQRKTHTEPIKERRVESQLSKIANTLDKFLASLRDLHEQYEKMPKSAKRDQLDATPPNKDAAAKHRADQWKQWLKDSVDAIAKLPDGFVPDSSLLNTVSTIFEEVQKQTRGKTREIDVPLEGGAKALAEETKEDLEMWMPHSADNIKWVMEDPMEGKFDVPEAPLPDNLQDMVGALLQQAQDFDQNADDVTSSWGGNMQAGWGIKDGPMSSFGARGKTGNTLPNNDELTGRAGSGRRGRASGQSVGATSHGLEGRHTPARLTNEPYEKGNIKATKQLNPDGSTGGGRKTGGGQRGLQGGTPPDMVKDMQRLAQNEIILREKTEQIARQLNFRGRSLDQVDRALTLMKNAEQSYRDMRYRDAAHQRKLALSALRQAMSQVDHPIDLSMQQARDLPPQMRQQITAGARQALPQGYEDLVGAYYQALSKEASK